MSSEILVLLEGPAWAPPLERERRAVERALLKPMYASPSEFSVDEPIEDRVGREKPVKTTSFVPSSSKASTSMISGWLWERGGNTSVSVADILAR